MAGIESLDQLLASLKPELSEKEYVFTTSSNTSLEAVYQLAPIATFQEEEGLTLILEKHTADKNDFTYEGCFKKISLKVHSSLAAVGLTAAISQKLTEENISANVIAAYYHDHVFVPKNKAEQALAALISLSDTHQL